MRDRRNQNRRAAVAAGVIGAVVSVGLRLWAKAARRPVDALALLGAAAASLVIVVNAVFLQSGSHPAPFFSHPARPQAAETAPSAAITAASKPAEVTAAVHSPPLARLQTPTARRNDPIAQLIGSSVGSPSRVQAVQRVLSEFGYGQIKVSGTLDQATSAAIARFEGEHKLPVTGRLSDRLLSELATMSGHPLH